MKRIIRYLKRLDIDQKWIERIAVTLIIVTAILIYGFKGDSENITIEEADAGGQQKQQTEKLTSQKIYIDIDGAVKEPGVYRLEAGQRIFHAIKRAGGLTKDADTSSINRAEKLKDGQKIHIPIRQADNKGTSYTSGDPAGSTDSGKISINDAGSEELQKISGVGPATAEKIIQYRETNGRFESLEDLMKVSGIGEKTFQKLKGGICL